MFNKNGKFKLIFWGTMLVILGGLGITGLVYKILQGGGIGEKNTVSDKTTDAIIIEVIIPSLADEATLKNFIVSIFNDSNKFLVTDNNIVTLSDIGKITSTAKFLYLNDEITFDNGLTNDVSTAIVTRTKDLYGDYVRLDNFKINYGDGICASSGFDSVDGAYGTGSKEANGYCTNPLMYFFTESIRYDRDTYAVKVKALYVNETDYNDQTVDLTGISCNEGQTKVNKTVTLYKDILFNQKVTEQNTDICCMDGTTCPTGGAIKLQSNFTNDLNNNGNTYYLRFQKDKDTKSFTLQSIELK